MNDFKIHQKLLDDCFVIGDLELSKVLLMNDVRFPWLILVPRVDDLRDLHDLPRTQWLTLFDEIKRASEAVTVFSDAHKVNVAALGNQVPQLHVHVIGRNLNDDAWPGPVWGVGTAEHYTSPQEVKAVDFFKNELAL